jgi:hypothetical protein
MLQFHVEKTDLFGGAANYSWVERGTLYVPDTATDRQIVRRAKSWAGWTGMRCNTENWGDTIRVDATPSGLLNVMFITFKERVNRRKEN